VSSSDNIKDALIAAFPGTTAAQWKRRGKKPLPSGHIEREFENTKTKQIVCTLEAKDGQITIGGKNPAIRLYDPALAAAVTATGQAELSKLVEAVEEVVEIGDTDSILAPAPTVKAERNTMVPGSRWVFHRTVDIKLWMPKAPGSRSHHAKDYHQVVVQTLLAGTKFTVLDKFGTSYSVADDLSDGLVARVKFDDESTIKSTVPFQRYDRCAVGLTEHRSGADFSGSQLVYKVNGHELPFKQIADAITAEAIPETLVYVLRDTATGEYFGGWKMLPHRDPRWANNGELYTSDVPKMVTKFSSAKKYKNASAVKASIRDFTGYNSGINDEGEEINYIFADGKKKMDLPATWEMVVVDKVTGIEKEILDVQNWYRDLLRLRTLTQGCGPAVRAAYKKGEGKGHGAIVLFQNRDRGLDYRGKPYEEAETFEDSPDGGKAALAAIKEATDAMGSKFDRVKLQSSVAVACSMADAMAAKMTVDYHSLDITLYDFNTLEKIVESQPAFA
jgi:hypothetical protein